MDVAVVLTLVQTILQLLDSSVSEEIKFFLGFNSQLEKLKNTMSTIQAVLTNVERLESQQLPISIPKVTLERLEDAVYEADDLFDEVATAAHLKSLMPGNKLSKEVHLLFSRFNQLSHTFTMSREIRKIRGILDDIAKDHHDFGKMVSSSCHHNVEGVSNIESSRETGAFVDEEGIIGRDEDTQIVKNFLLDTSLDDTISYVSIVGMGGLGKTALAQLVYKDHQIQTEFSPKMWVCVSHDFNVKSLLRQILASDTQRPTSSELNMNQLKAQVLQKLNGNNYLLVLDDVWNEDDLMEWDELKRILDQGGKGSRIIVTTRSQRVAEVAGSYRTHVLKGLSDDDSWKLFQKMTRKQQQDQMKPHLVEIGKDIVRKCFNVPLAIRFVGSFLQGKDEREWERLNKNDLAQIKNVENKGIIPVLKISYNHLPSCVKSCFSYCAVFPKDYEFKKEELICLWMAQGFVRGSDLEDLAEECFRMLLQRCFFQDVELNILTGKIVCKMHDLVHDLAIDVSKIKIVELPVNKFGSSWDNKTRHIFIDDTLFKTQEDVERYLGMMKRFRTCILRQSNLSKFYHAELPFKMRNLRVLDLSDSRRDLKMLPSMIGEMLHLRYLDLSCNNGLCKLPNSITQLYNLQTLKLFCCSGLKELPRDLSKLVNLRHLGISCCFSLRHMPGRMNNMKCLRKLTRFVVGDDVRKKAGDVGKLEDIKDLNNLTGDITIEIKDGWRIYDAEKVKEGGYLIHKPLLNKIIIFWDRKWSHDDGDAEALLQGLQPHPNIKKLVLVVYPGVGFPRWGNYSSMMNLAESLPNLVEIALDVCRRLKSLPSLSQLRHLKVLRLEGLTKLEYVESSSNRNGDNELVFFPLLTELILVHLPELKGWWKESTSTSTSQVEMEATSTAGEGGEIARGDVNHIKNEFLGFPSLSTLHISRCYKLETLPGLPKLKKLELQERNTTTLLDHLHLHSLPESFKYPPEISIENDDKMERLSAVELFRSGRLYYLLSLQINNCRKLKSISGRQVWEHLKALETLELSQLPELELEDSGCDDDEMHMPWRWVAPTLRRLTLDGLDKMVKMPKGIQHLTSLVYLMIDFSNVEEIPGWIGCLSSLKTLIINNCSRVKSLPEEMRHLTCLTHLTLSDCSEELKERCKNPTGVDWPKIKHIPYLSVTSGIFFSQFFIL